ncbi:MAG: flagellar hook-basal body complex protein FliE [Phycisphaerales bacterium]|nr:flagellar hook-basal body complex protein FliE [Phycisphaerales bacterium]
MDALKQLQSLQVNPTAPGISSPQTQTSQVTGEGESFKDVLMKNLNEVNQMQQDADKQVADFVSGRTNNLGEVISATQKASMAFSMLTQIRNTLQNTYDELKNLRI